MRNLRLRAFHRGEGTPQGASGARNGEGRRSGVFNRIITAAVALTATVALAVPTAYAVTADMSANASNADSSVQADTTANGESTGASSAEQGDAAADQSGETDTNGDSSTQGGDTSADADPETGGVDTAADAGTAEGSDADAADTDTADPAQGDSDSTDAGSADTDAQSADGDETSDDDVVAYADEESDGVTLVDESFTDANVTSSSWKFYGQACLTNATSGDLWCGGSDKGMSDTEQYQQSKADGGVNRGEGYLQLTDNSTGKYGIALYDSPVYANAGLDIEFDQWQFGGKGADGIGFFLTQGSGVIQQGPHGEDVGGALAYGTVYNANKKQWEEGIPYGLLGVGLDVYGSFSSNHQVGSDSNPNNGDNHSKYSNSVTVRGTGETDNQGRWLKGYKKIASKRVKQVKNYLDLSTDKPSQKYTSNDSGIFGSGDITDNTNISGQANGVHVHITLSKPENGKQELNVYITQAGESREYNVISTEIDAISGTVRFGFSASTGSVTDAHFIRNLTVKSATKVGAIALAKEIDVDSPNYKAAYSEGDTVPYQFTVTNTGTEELSNVTLSDPFVTNIACTASNNQDVSLPNKLSVGEQWVCTGSMELSADLVSEQAGVGWSEDGTSFTNRATVSAQGENGNPIDPVSSDWTIDTIAPLGKPDHEKTITECTDGSCQYTLNLDVTGGTSGSSTSRASDVVVVLDRSSSMDYSMGGSGSGSRMQVAKDAINQFADELLSSGTDNRMSLVTFSSSGKENSNSATTRISWSNSASDVKTVVDDITVPYNAGTNWQAGFRQAAELLESARSEADKYVVFLSDGDPTHYFGNLGFEWSFPAKTAYDKAVEAAKELGKNVTVFSVGVSSSPEKMDDLASDLNKDGYSSDYFSGADEEELDAAIDSILQAVTTTSSYTNVSIKDTLSEYMNFAFNRDSWSSSDVWISAEYVDESESTRSDPQVPSLSKENVTFSSTDSDGRVDTITVSFGKDFTLAAGVKYTLHVKVQPTQKAFDEATWATDGVSQDYSSNAEDGASLTYTQATSVTGDSSSSSTESKTILYKEDPKFQVKASKITIEKKWSGNAPSNVSEITVKVKQDGTDYDTVTLKKGSDGNWSTEKVYVPAGPTGHTYSVEEAAIAGWKPSYSYELSDTTDSAENQDNSGVKLQGLCPQSATATITNTQNMLTAQQGLIKTLEGREWDEDDVFTFLITSDSKGAIAPKNATPVPDEPRQWTIKVGYNNLIEPEAWDSPERGIVIEFETEAPTDGENHEYTYTVTEVVPGAGEALAGMTYSQAEWTFELVLNRGSNGSYIMSAQQATQVTDDDGAPFGDGTADTKADGEGDSETYAVSSPIVFTNQFGSVSDLPLTGGDATLRSILLTGGGLVLLAGGAWLLSRRRRA